MTLSNTLSFLEGVGCIIEKNEWSIKIKIPTVENRETAFEFENIHLGDGFTFSRCHAQATGVTLEFKATLQEKDAETKCPKLGAKTK